MLVSSALTVRGMNTKNPTENILLFPSHQDASMQFYFWFPEFSSYVDMWMRHGAYPSAAWSGIWRTSIVCLASEHSTFTNRVHWSQLWQEAEPTSLTEAGRCAYTCLLLEAIIESYKRKTLKSLFSRKGVSHRTVETAAALGDWHLEWYPR